jgi:hypothetical protein
LTLLGLPAGLERRIPVGRQRAHHEAGVAIGSRHPRGSGSSTGAAVLPGRPLSVLLQFHAWAWTRWGYHLVNIVLHAVSACLAAAILRRLAVPGWWLTAALFCRASGPG